MTDTPSESNKEEPKKEETKPAEQPPKAAESTPAPKPAAAKPPVKKPPVKKELPKPVFNQHPTHPAYQGRASQLLSPGDRMWPTRVWADKWNLPRYRNGAIMLAGIIGGLTAGSVLIHRFGLAAWNKFWGILWGVIGSAGIAAGLTPEHIATAKAFHETSPFVWIPLKVILVLNVILVAPIFLVWWERKISAHMQSRFGPMYVGWFHGVLQTVADGIKLLLKENIQPKAADKWVHQLAPAVVCVPAILAFAPISFGGDLIAANIDVSVLYVFAMAGISVVGIMMAGWGSGNKYSLLGGLRSAAQLVSYELPRGFAIMPVIMFSGSLSLVHIASAQSGYWFGFLPKWFIFYPVVGQIAFLIFLIASVAETNRTPFDIPEAESELVAGFHTEYSGMRFSLFFLAEYAYMLLACLLMAAFFFGGGNAPLPFLEFIPGWYWFLAKTLALVFVFMWFRWTFPRFRVDRVMDFNWKFLLPWSFANIAFAGLYLIF
jgi:NADH-quinone oxidoreductase subunit H